MLCAAASLSTFVGDLDLAGRFYEEALALFEQLGMQQAEAMATSDAGHLDYMLGHFESAKVRFARLAHLALELADEKLAANAEYGVARVALAEKQRDLSRRHFESALAGYIRVGHRSNQALALLNLGTLAYAGSDPDSARGHLTKALTLARESGDEMIENSIVRCIGDVEARRGNVPAARVLLKQALESNWQTDDMLEVTLCLRSAAILAFRTGDSGEGAVLLGAAMRVGARFERLLGALLTQDECALVDAARDALAGDFEGFERQGAAMSTRSAIDAAIRHLRHKPPSVQAPHGSPHRKRARSGQPSRGQRLRI